MSLPHIYMLQGHQFLYFILQVTAKGIPEKPINMLFDLHLSMALLLGEVCGHSITVQPSVKTESVGSTDVDEDNEAVMLKSNLWKTLFRAGYQPTSDKMLQRSLSGRYVSYMGKTYAYGQLSSALYTN